MFKAGLFRVGRFFQDDGQSFDLRELENVVLPTFEVLDYVYEVRLFKQDATDSVTAVVPTPFVDGDGMYRLSGHFHAMCDAGVGADDMVGRLQFGGTGASFEPASPILLWNRRIQATENVAIPFSTFEYLERVVGAATATLTHTVSIPASFDYAYSTLYLKIQRVL